MSVATLIEAVAILIRLERFLHPNICWTIPEVYIQKMCDPLLLGPIFLCKYAAKTYCFDRHFCR